MKLYRIKILLKRHLMSTTREFHRFIDIIYWPFLEIILWGLTGVWLQGNTEHLSMYTTMLLAALIFWQIFTRAEHEIISSLVDELWSYNLINLFSSPLEITEWIISAMSLGIIKSIFTMVFGIIITWSIYGCNLTLLGTVLFPLFILFIISGWALGFFMSALIIYWSHKIQSFIWALDWTLAAFSTVYYSIEVLPSWAQYIAYALPMTHTFYALRTFIQTGILPVNAIYTSLLLSFFYLILSMYVFINMFSKSKGIGLLRLEQE